jgi:hypothetical protein
VCYSTSVWTSRSRLFPQLPLLAPLFLPYIYVYLSLSPILSFCSLFCLCRSHFLCLPLARFHAKRRCYPTGRCTFRLPATCDWWEGEKEESDRPSFTVDCQTPLSLPPPSPPETDLTMPRGRRPKCNSIRRGSADSSIRRGLADRGLADSSIRRGLANSRSRPQEYVAQQQSGQDRLALFTQVLTQVRRK